MRINKYIGLIILLISFLTACSPEDLMLYDASMRSLYVNTDEGADSTEFSFKHHLGADEYVIRMPVYMNGLPLEEDKTFNVVVDKDLTTARAEDYSVELEQIFHAGILQDYVSITLYRTNHLATDKVRVALRLVPNETFSVSEYIGDPGSTSLPRESDVVRVIFSDMISKPDWWDDRITMYYLGEYSDEKYTYFIESSGRTDLEGCSSSDIRLILQKFREDIRINGWTEADGSPIEIVMH